MSEILKRTKILNTKILLCERGLKCFSPLRGIPILNNTLSPDIFISAQYSKGTTKAPARDLLRLNTLRDTKTAFSTLKAGVNVNLSEILVSLKRG